MHVRSIRGKVIALSVMGVALTAIALIGVVLFQRGGINTQNQIAQREVSDELFELAQNETGKIAENVYLMCRAQQEALEQKVRSDLSVARDVLRRTGAVSFSTVEVDWTAVNQFSKSANRIALPKMMVGEVWLDQNQETSAVSPIVDEVKNLVGGTCTIFQRMNTAGDMLRVCTNVEKKDGTRAIGTYIPAVNPDGSPNAVVSTVMNGQTFNGRAFVVDAWYITAYEPIRDASGEIAGVLYVGVKQENTQSLRKGIKDIVVGKTGSVFVTGGSGNQKGVYAIHKQSNLEGQSILSLRDADGNPVGVDIVEKAVQTSMGATDFICYPITANDGTQQKIINAVTYFNEWDWIICASVNEVDYQEARVKVANAMAKVDDSVSSMVVYTVYGALALFILVGIIAAVVAGKIAAPLNGAIQRLGSGADQVSSASQQISASGQSLASGAGEQASSIEESSSALEELAGQSRSNAEMAQDAASKATVAQDAAQEASEAMDQTVGAMREMKQSSDKISGIIKTIEEIAFQTNLLALNAAVEAARAGDHGKGFAVVAGEVRNLAQRAATSAKDTAGLIEENVKQSNHGVDVVTQAAESIASIKESIASVAETLNQVNTASNQQAQGVEQINVAVSQMEIVTQQVAANAEESASAAEELSAQAIELNTIVDELMFIAEGSHDNIKKRQENAPLEANITSHAVQPSRKQKTVSTRPSHEIKTINAEEIKI